MPDSISLALAGRAVTYFAQIAVAYALVQILSRVIISARWRMWLWSAFLLGALLGWLALLLVPVEVSPGPAHAFEWSYRIERMPSDLKLWEHRGLQWYLFIAVSSLLVWAYRRLRLRALLRAAEEPTPEISLLFFRLAKKMKVESCRVVLVPELRSPSMAGWLRPCVFLPRELVPQLERSELVHVLLHELIHVRRRDYVWDQLATLACRVVFFHPAVWLARRRLRRERELACDQAMGGRLATRRLRYAECLMRLAKWWFLADGYSVAGVGASSAASFLSTRVRILLDQPRCRSQAQIFLRAGLAILIAVLGAYGVWNSKLRFERADANPLEAHTLPHKALSRPRRVHAARATHWAPALQQHQQAAAAPDRESNDSEFSGESETEESWVDGEETASAEGQTLSTESGRIEGRRSAAANQTGFEGESQPNWNEGSVERSPLSRPHRAGAAATAVKVAIGVALAMGDDDFVGGR
jgi:beta-lactamase regulating signal transducer with metallopeptidase domain